MPKFFQVEKAAYSGEKNSFQNVKFKKGNLENSAGSEAGTLLEIIPVHVKNPPVVQFIAYLDTLSDTFNSQQTAVQPFGRTDPYYMWKSNKRTIRVGFSIPSTSVSMGLDNLNNLSWFLGSLYPTYKDTQVATSIAASPMFRVRFANLICSTTRSGQGLLGVIQSVSVNPDVKNGFIGIGAEDLGSSYGNIPSNVIKNAGFDNSLPEGKKILVPKLIKISFSLDVVHDHALGWDYETGQWRGGLSAPGFPYNFGLTRDTTDTPSVGSTQGTDASAGPAAPVPPNGADDKHSQVNADELLASDDSGARGLEKGLKP